MDIDTPREDGAAWTIAHGFTMPLPAIEVATQEVYYAQPSLISCGSQGSVVPNEASGRSRRPSAHTSLIPVEPADPAQVPLHPSILLRPPFLALLCVIPEHG